MNNQVKASTVTHELFLIIKGREWQFMGSVLMELSGFEVQADAALKNCILDKRRVQSKVKVIAGEPAASPPGIPFNAFSSCLPLYDVEKPRYFSCSASSTWQAELPRVCSPNSLPGGGGKPRNLVAECAISKESLSAQPAGSLFFSFPGK